ncbi:heterokaryon incompatibility protein-domain-containing protein [Xylogone sp. PMI_703]|nr:heterokaryon incompatibility protein-domain-containing protein [Xylogone sp. PMI_703]
MPPMTAPNSTSKAALIEKEEYNAIFNENGDYIGYTVWGYPVNWEKDYGNPPTWAEMTANYSDCEGLCEICEKIDFKNFITPTEKLSPDDPVYAETAEREREWFFGGKELDDEDGKEIDILLGTVQELYERHEKCGFCQWAFLFALFSYQKTGAPLEGVVRLKKETTGAQSYQSTKYARIYVDCSAINEADKDATEAEKFPFIERRLCPWRDEPKERPIAPNKDEEPRPFFFPLMSMSWLYRGCTNQHPKCTAATRLREKKPMKTTLFVIDLHDFCIVRAPEDCVYAALSYVWGAQPGEYDTDIIPSSDIERVDFPARHSLTMIHACNVVKQLGIRYIWVDQVCIPADCRREQIYEMDTIYRGADLTVIAGVENASSGLPGVGSTNRKRQSPGVLRVGGINVGVQTWDSSIPALRDTVYSSRGWTYQEKVLSPRLLIITEEDMYYHCLEGEKAEHACHESNVIEFRRETFVEFGSVLATAHGRSPFQIWADCVNEYMGRNLTYPGDIMHGFAGLMSFLEEKYEWKFCWGIPDEHFALGLLWAGARGLKTKRREAFRDDGNQKLYPSWSWTGWMEKTHHYGVRPRALVPAEEQEKMGFVPVKWSEGMLESARESGIVVLEGECVVIGEGNVGNFGDEQGVQGLEIADLPDESIFMGMAMLKEKENDAYVGGLVLKKSAGDDLYERATKVNIKAVDWLAMTRERRTIHLI